MIKTLTSCLSWFAGMLRMRLVVFVCVSPFGAVTLLTFRLLIGPTRQRSGSIMGFDSLSCLHSQFSKATLSLASFFTTLATFATQSFSFSTLLSGSLSYIVNVYMILVLLCFILGNVYFLYLLSLTVLMLFFVLNGLKLFTFYHFLRVCLKSSDPPYPFKAAY